MQKLILALILASSLCGCTTWMRSYVAVHDAVDAVLEDGQAPAQPAGPQTLWPAVECDWMRHGEGSGENELRAAAIKEAAASGKAIRFKFRETGTDLRFWILWWESDVDRGKLPNPEMATPKALAAGVKRWVVDVTDCSDALVCDTFKAYGGPDFQLQVIGASPGVIKGLGLDGQGIKTTPPTFGAISRGRRCGCCRSDGCPSSS